MRSALALAVVLSMLLAFASACNFTINSAGNDRTVSFGDDCSVNIYNNDNRYQFTTSFTGVTVGSNDYPASDATCVSSTSGSVTTHTWTYGSGDISGTSIAFAYEVVSGAITGEEYAGVSYDVPSNSLRTETTLTPSNIPSDSDVNLNFRVNPPSNEVPSGSASSCASETQNEVNTAVASDQSLDLVFMYPTYYADDASSDFAVTMSIGDLGPREEASERRANAFFQQVMTLQNVGGTVTARGYSVIQPSAVPDDTGSVINLGPDSGDGDGDGDDDDDSSIGAIIGGILGGTAGLVLIPIVLILLCLGLLALVAVVILVVIIVVAVIVLIVVVLMVVLKVGPFSGGGGPVSKNTQIWWDDTDYEDEEEDDEDDDEDDDSDEDEIESSDF